MKHRRLLLSVTLFALLGAASSAMAETTTIQGELIDPALYLREGRRGMEAEDAIYDAVDAGQTLAILEDGTGTIYLLLAGESGEDPNDLAYEHIAHRVKASGTVYERGGLKGLVAMSVESLEAPVAQTSDAPAEPHAQP